MNQNRVKIRDMAAKFQDYYESLGVPRTATAEEIKQAFRKLARLCHPDVAADKVGGEARFKEINEAYEVLGDPTKKLRYDELFEASRQGGVVHGGAPGRGRSPGGDAADFEYAGTGFSDFFESFFAGGRGASRTRRTGGGDGGDDPFGALARDVDADFMVTLEEALLGASRKITLRRPGRDGAAERLDTYQVRIPPGIREGQRIRLAGQGDSSPGGGAAGDLYLHVRLARHPDFSVEGSDLHATLDLAPWEAVLGTKIKLTTLDGETSLKVPPGMAAGGLLRLRGLGLPRQEGGRGDLLVTMRMVTPAPVSPEERVLWEQLSRVATFNPRSTT